MTNDNPLSDDELRDLANGLADATQHGPVPLDITKNLALGVQRLFRERTWVEFEVFPVEPHRGRTYPLHAQEHDINSINEAVRNAVVFGIRHAPKPSGHLALVEGGTNTAVQKWKAKSATMLDSWPETVWNAVLDDAADLTRETGCSLETSMAALSLAYSAGYCTGQNVMSDHIEARENAERG